MTSEARPDPGLAPIDWERLARSEVHPLRIDVLEVLRLDGGRMLSVNEMAYELHSPVPKVHYHTTVLAKFGFVVAVAHRQIRGATEHFYVLEGQEGITELLQRIIGVGGKRLVIDKAVDD